MQTGYTVYESYTAERTDIIHELCWTHTRRTFLKAEESEPQATGQILALIGVLYRIEEQLRKIGADDKVIVETR